jgi:hypothetical protein
MGERPRPRTRRPGRALLLAAWLVSGIVLVGQARLPDPPAAAASPVLRPPGGCWVVRVATTRGGSGSLAVDRRRLRAYGLPAAIWRSGHWRAIRPGTRALVVPARARASALAVRARVVRLGHRDAVVRPAPRTACRR